MVRQQFQLKDKDQDIENLKRKTEAQSDLILRLEQKIQKYEMEQGQAEGLVREIKKMQEDKSSLEFQRNRAQEAISQQEQVIQQLRLQLRDRSQHLEEENSLLKQQIQYSTIMADNFNQKIKEKDQKIEQLSKIIMELGL